MDGLAAAVALTMMVALVLIVAIEIAWHKHHRRK